METTNESNVQSETQPIIGYKAFNNDMTCLRKFQYEVGKTYTMNPDEIKICERGFHFCIIPIDVLYYYPKDSTFACIKANGKIVHDDYKSVCSQITIEKLITLDELYQLTTGKYFIQKATVYYQKGKYHRIDGPAIEWLDGTKEWLVNGKYHRMDGPAVERSDGTKEWYIDGHFHHMDGPASERSDGKYSYLN